MEKGWIIVHSLYLILEPLWYRSVSRWSLQETAKTGVPPLLVPPADTRIPLHTVFDHINAALASFNLLNDGCMALIDLAGVQSWIAESRRLRDLWASSWLASFLAWKTVEPFVKKYGPGVLVSSPGRLHPFYSASVLGWFLDILKDSPNGKEFNWLYHALGIPEKFKWPALSTTPSRYILALPGEACEGFKRRAMEAYREAWMSLVTTLSDLLSNALESLSVQVSSKKDLVSLLRRLEPPLPLRAFLVKYEAGGPDPLDRATAYHRALQKLFLEESERGVSLSGRRSGPGYMEYVRRVRGERRSERCTVCGRSPAILKVGDVRKALRSSYPSNRIIEELGDDDERLCPYCLVKRALRVVLTGPLSKDLVGMKADRNNLPSWDTVTNASSRVRAAVSIAASEMAELICDLADLDYEILKTIIGGVKKASFDAIELLYNELVRNDAPEDILKCIRSALPESGPSFHFDPDSIRMASYIVFESLVYDAFISRIKENIEKYELDITVRRLISKLEVLAKEFKPIPRRYAYLKADGDYIGRLLQGKLPGHSLSEKYGIRPAGAKEYYLHVFSKVKHDIIGRILRDEGVNVLVAAVERAQESMAALQALDGECKDKSGDEDDVVTIYVYPSYHISLSRSLAAMSFLDMITVLSLGGQLVYAGGDDVLAIVPPLEIARNRMELTALEAAKRLRSNWWGLPGVDIGGRERIMGFIGVTSQEESGAVILHVAPAPAAYGRSIAVYLSDSLKPMWSAISIAGELEEVKDCFTTRLPGSKRWRKDMLIVASDSRGSAVTSLYIPEGSARPGCIVDAVKEALGMAYPSRQGARVGSGRLLHSLPEYLKYAEAYVDMGRTGEALRMVEYGIKRGLEVEEVDPESLLTCLVRVMDCTPPGEYSIGQEDRLKRALDVRLMYRPERLNVYGLELFRTPYLLSVIDANIRDSGSILTSIFSSAYIYQNSLPSPKTRIRGRHLGIASAQCGGG